jgi:glycosyltransferase involved in cell wall biosynthesis
MLEKNQLTVSIVMPLYNAAAYVETAIASVIAQTYAQWQLIIVDDGSTDQGVAIVEKMQQQDARIQLLKNTVNSGAVVSRNKAIEAATGQIIAFLDSDDAWHPTKLEKQITEYQRQPQTALVFSNYEHMGAQGNLLGKIIVSPDEVDYQLLLKSNCIGCLTATYNTQVLGKRFFVQQGHEDYILWLSILKQGYIAKNVGECLAAYRLSANSLSANKFKAASWQWKIYRQVEKLNPLISAYYFVFYVWAGLKKHR